MTRRPRIAVCGIHIESSTFTPYTSVEQDFVVTRGDALLARYDWLDTEWARAVDWVPVLHAGALPGGVVERDIYERWREEIRAGLAAAHAEAPLDGVFFDIHGAMSVHGYDDAEGDLVTAVRDAVGPEPMLSASMDLHGNVSDVLFDACDLMTCYRMAPHEDALESRERAARNLVDRLRQGQGKPAKALVHVPVLLPGEKTSTRIEPGKCLYALVPVAEKVDGVTDAAIWIGFAWADQPRCKGAVVVYGDDPRAVELEARALGQAFWDVHEQFEFVAPVASMAECLQWAETAKRPTFISDSGDNPGAGGADDVTVALAHLLAWQPVIDATLDVIHASIVDPVAAGVCWEAGVGAEVTVEIGGHIDTRAPGPQQVTGRVRALTDDPRGGHTAALTIGGLTVILTTSRNQYTEHVQFERLGLDVRTADVVVVKIGYLEPDLFDAQADWKMALTPGGVDQDLVRLGHHRIDRPMFPFDADMHPGPMQVRVVVP
ncbi:M81 family metallopeptidase [Schaalia sp. 19OD2882]|uniref:M81 family metallopeptidase n=1 Tax=Schaalia sp. 19OD2882 TaxID=2794089 RepID=UPI001C1EBCFA|nr:M81 family metallopeptidase [Schaalia sp. 19OD2882]QWW20517.1 M81 family metallopeptidase [Schaalia sp. 19OD2882]